MPVTIQPATLKYKNSQGTYQSADCLKGDLNENLLAPEFSANSTYAVGDHVIYNGEYYVCDTAVSTAGAWNSTSWTKLTVGSELAITKSALSDKYEKPSGGIPASDLASGVIPTVPVTDVQVEGASILSQGVANIPYASEDTLGLTATRDYFGLQAIKTGPDKGRLQTVKATDANIKTGTNNYKPIVPANQQTAVFYGLAKAACDSTQASSANAVGTYTSAAKAAIQSMLGIQSSVYLTETVTGTTPSITAAPNIKYICGEVSTLSVTPPANGTCDIIFESGSTATTLTVPNTVKWPSWFDATSLETDTIYEIMITDATYGSVMTWATT